MDLVGKASQVDKRHMHARSDASKLLVEGERRGKVDFGGFRSDVSGEKLMAGLRADLSGLRSAAGSVRAPPPLSRTSSPRLPSSLPGAPQRPEALTKAPAAPRLARCGLDAGHNCAHALVLCSARFLPLCTGMEAKAGATVGGTTPFLLSLHPSPAPTPSNLDLLLPEPRW